MRETILNKTENILSLGSNERFVGRAQVLLSALSFGAISTFAKFAYAEGVHAPMLLALRFLVAAIALWTYFSIFKRDVVRIGRKELATCAALGLAGYGIFSSLVFKAFETTPASIAGMLFFSYPVFAMVLEWAVSRKRPDAQLMLGGAVILVGISLGALGATAGNLTVGMLLALGGAAWYAAYVVASRRLLQNLRPQTVALYVTSFAAIGFWFMGGPVISQLHGVTTWGWLMVFSIAIISTVVALLSFFSGLEKLGSAEASQIGTFELIVSLTLATFILGEPLRMPVILGAGFILFGIVMGQYKPAARHRECPNDTIC